MPKLFFKDTDPTLINPGHLEFIAFVEGGIPLERLRLRLLPKMGAGEYGSEVAAHDGWGDYSSEGFMGVDDDPLEFIHADLMTVLRHDLTPKKVADGVSAFYGDHSILHPDYEFIGATTDSTGSQSCPWECPEVIGVDDGIIVKKELKERPGGNLMIALAMTSSLSEGGMRKHVDDAVRLFREGHEIVTEARDDVGRVRALQQTGEVFTAQLTSMLAHEIGEHCLFGAGPGSPYRADPEFLIHALNLAKKH